MAFPRLVRERPPAEDALAERSDDELMQLARAGLQDAFATLVERHAARIINLCSRFAGDGQLGHELAQDTWVLVWQGRDKYRQDGGFRAWLTTVACNHCRNQLRRRRLTRAHEQPDESELPVTPGQLDDLLQEERRRRVRRALGELSYPMREALLLRYAEDLRYDEMTSVVGTGESTLRSRVHHALKILKQKLEDA